MRKILNHTLSNVLYTVCNAYDKHCKNNPPVPIKSFWKKCKALFLKTR